MNMYTAVERILNEAQNLLEGVKVDLENTDQDNWFTS
jgi:hypothetical protein